MPENRSSIDDMMLSPFRMCSRR